MKITFPITQINYRVALWDSVRESFGSLAPELSWNCVSVVVAADFDVDFRYFCKCVAEALHSYLPDNYQPSLVTFSTVFSPEPCVSIEFSELDNILEHINGT